MDNNLMIRLFAMLDKIKSKIRIQQDIKQLEKTLSMKLNASLNKNNSRANITRDLKHISTGQEIKVKARVDRKSLQSSLNSARQQVENSSRSQPVNISSRVNVNSNSLNQANQAQNELINGGSRIRDVVQYYVNWQKVLDLIVQSARKAVDASVELAKAQTNLQIVTGKSNEQMQLLMRGYNKLAQDLSSTTLNVTNAADQWLRQGKSVAETNELVKDSVILSKIGQLEESEATKYLTSAMNGYKVATEDVIGVVDKLSAVDLASATSAGGLAESMSKTANSAKIAGVSMDNLIGYIATVTDVSQKSASVVGESFKTIFSRMGKVSIGDFIDDDGTDITEQINQVEGILGKFNIKLRDSADEFRNFEDVIYDVGMSWDSFTSVEKNAIAAGFGGVYQRENVLTLFENFDKAMKLSEVSANSAGTALQKFATYENGLEAATNRLTASLESLAYNTVNSDFMIDLADGAAAIVDFVDKTKLIQTGLTALTFTGIIKGLLMFNTKMVAVKNNMNAMTTAMNLSTKTTQRTRAENVLLGQSYAKLTPAQQRLLLSNKKLNMEQKIAILRASGLTRAQARAKLQAMGLATATNTAANATFSLRGAWETLKLSIASNPIGLIVTVLTSASMIISTAIEKQKELEEAAKAAAEEARNEADEIKDLYSEYSELSEEIQKDASRKDELSTVTDNLLKKLGYEKSAVENLTKEYGDLDTAIKSVTLEGLQDKWDNLLVDYGTKKKALTDLLPGKTLIDGNRVLNVRNDKGLNDYEDTIQMLEKSGLFDEILRPYANETGADLNISFILPDGLEDVEGMKRYYNIVSKAIQILNQEYSSEMLIDNAVYQKFVSIQTEIRNKMNEFGVAVNSANENLAMQQILTSEIANGVPKTAEGFKKYREALIESALSNNQFVGTEEDIESAINSSLRSMPEFAEFFEAELPEAIDNSIPSVQKLTDAYKDLEEQIERILDLQSKLSDAFEKVASGEVFTAEEAYNLVKEIPELYKSITPVEGGFSFSLDGLESAYKAQNEGLIKQIKENSKENQKVIDYYNEQKNKLDGLQSDTTASTGIRGFNALEADTKTSGYSEDMTVLKQSADEASEIIKQNNALINILNGSLESHSMKLEGITTQYEIARDKIDDYNSHVETIDKAISSLNENNALTYDEMAALVEISPVLKSAFTEQGNGYYIAIDSLELLKEQSYTTRNSYIDDLIAMAEAEITSAEATKKALGDKINSWDSYISYTAEIAEVSAEISGWQDLIDKLTALKGKVYETDSSNSSGEDTISDKLQQEIDYYDKIIQGIEAVADKRIEAIDKEIEAINEQKDALKEQNDERQRELDLIEAQNNLGKAKKQKVFVYKEGQGLVQVQDEKAVKDAQKELDDARREIKEAEYDKQIDLLEQQSKATEEYRDTFSDMKSDIEDAIAVEQAKSALGTDEKGLLNLDNSAIDSIQNGLAKAVVEKENEDNKGNPYYKDVTWADLMKKIGSNATMDEFKAKVYDPMMNSFSPEKLYNIQGGSNNQYITNNSPTTVTATFNISGATDPNEVAKVVRTEITDLLQRTYNKVK